MATAAEIRDWAQEHSYDLGSKGRIPAGVRTAYEAAHPGQPPDPAPDYPPGMGDDDFSDPAEPPSVPEPDTGETKPKSGTARARRGFPKLGSHKGKRAKAKAPRVPVDDAICTVWRGLARIARPLPPLERTLRIQAPVAGLLLEDTVKGTIVDTALQPLARMQTQSRTVIALAGPPVLVTAITLHCQRAAVAGQQPNPVFMSMATEMLRESLMVWQQVAGPKFADAMEREKRFEAEFGQSIDAMLELIMAPPAAPGDTEAQAAEDDAIKRAQGIL